MSTTNNEFSFVDFFKMIDEQFLDVPEFNNIRQYTMSNLEECENKNQSKEDYNNLEFANDCRMWELQLKSFILDSLIDDKKRNSQEFLNFLDELNKISTCY